MTEQPTVFLSYAREDRARVEQVYDGLKDEGFSVRLDTQFPMPVPTRSLISVAD
jgi:hypothetical protein